MCSALQKKFFDHSFLVCHDDSHLSSYAATCLETEVELLITYHLISVLVVGWFGLRMVNTYILLWVNNGIGLIFDKLMGNIKCFYK